MSEIIRLTGGDWRSRGREERYGFPEGWSLRSYPLRRLPELSDAELARRLRGPFPYREGKRSLEELARGCRRVVVLFDDLSRWTPADRLALPVLEILRGAGVQDRQVRFLAAVGSHRAMGPEELDLKLGPEIPRRFAVANHDCFSEEVVELGVGRYGTPIRLNREVVEADLVIGLGMLSAHGFAYVSGGAKILLPGVAHVESIRRNHRSSSGHRFEPEELRGDEAEAKYGPIRVEMDQAAEMLLERTRVVVVNAAMGPERGITELAVGDPLSVVRNQAAGLLERYRLSFARGDRVDLGVFRVDSLDPLQYYKGTEGWEQVCDRLVVVGDFSDRYVYQGQRHGRFEEHMRRLAEAGPMDNPPLPEALRDPNTIFLCSPHLDRVSARLFWRPFYVAPEWESLVAGLRRELGPDRSVAFFPDSYLQILEIDGVAGGPDAERR